MYAAKPPLPGSVPWRLALLAVLCGLICLPFLSTAQAAAPADETTGALSPVLCLPGVYLEDPQDCLPVGPSEYLTRLGRLGISFPQRPLPAESPSASLAVLPYYYLRLKAGEATPVYSTLEAAIAESSPALWIEAGDMRYLSYAEAISTNNQPKPNYFQLRSGGWIAAKSVSQRENAVIRYQGLTFSETPSHAFGWVIPLNPYVETKRTPGYSVQDATGRRIPEYGLVEVFDTQTVNDTEWYLVGPDEWLPGSTVGLVHPNPTPPEGVTNGRWIEINLYEQTLAVYDQAQLVFATLVATGAEPYYTRPGTFTIYKRLEATPMRGAFEADRSDFYYLEDVPYTMYYDQARALHAAYWRTRFGFAQSHGCVNLSPGDARWLYEWAQEGDAVYVWDPSGETPTDPAYYGEGGA